MMMVFGLFVFELRTAPYQNLGQESTFRHVNNSRVGKSPRYQYIGPGEDKITLGGTLYPEVTGGDVSLAALRTMAYTGKAYPLIEGTGGIYGMFVITGITETRTEFFKDGKARKIEFSLSLEKVSEDLREMLADVDMGLGFL